MQSFLPQNVAVEMKSLVCGGCSGSCLLPRAEIPLLPHTNCLIISPELLYYTSLSLHIVDCTLVDYPCAVHPNTHGDGICPSLVGGWQWSSPLLWALWRESRRAIICCSWGTMDKTEVAEKGGNERAFQQVPALLLPLFSLLLGSRQRCQSPELSV